jgi:hypothetical protein
MGKPSAAYAAKTIKGINPFAARCHTSILLPEGLIRFAFRRLSEKQKTKSL